MPAAIRAKPCPYPAAPEDFRVRVAAQKRARMRSRLIAATQDAYLNGGPYRTPVIDDVIRQAGVSRGTFYKYFDSLDEILAEVGRVVAGEMLTTYDRLFAAIKDPAVRIAVGPLMAMARAAMDPRHGAFATRVDFVEFLGGEDPGALIVRRSLTEAKNAGALDFDSLDAAIDVVIGATVEGVRRICRTGALDGAYMRELTAILMIGFGLSRKRAQSAVAEAWQHLQQQSAVLHWWKRVARV
jgi:AcrR family transcriptional regulator